MSAYKKISCVVKDGELLQAILGEMGIKFEVGDSLPLYGYRGDERQERADIVVRRGWIGQWANDIGWKQQPDGAYSLIISEYDGERAAVKGTRQHRLTHDVMQEYSRRELLRRYEAEGYTVTEKRLEDGRIELQIAPGRRTRIKRQARQRVRVGR